MRNFLAFITSALLHLLGVVILITVFGRQLPAEAGLNDEIMTWEWVNEIPEVIQPEMQPVEEIEPAPEPPEPEPEPEPEIEPDIEPEIE